jgi:hypothetical protein
MAFQTQENLQIRSPDGCEGNSVPSTVVRGCDFHKPGGYLRNVDLALAPPRHESLLMNPKFPNGL